MVASPLQFHSRQCHFFLMSGLLLPFSEIIPLHATATENCCVVFTDFIVPQPILMVKLMCRQTVLSASTTAFLDLAQIQKYTKTLDFFTRVCFQI